MLTAVRRSFLVAMGLGFSIFSAMVLCQLLKEFNLTGLTGFSFYLFFGIMGLAIGLSGTKKIIVDPEKKTIVVQGFCLVKNTYYFQELLGCKSFRFRNKWRSYSALFVQLTDSRQFAFTAQDFVNFKEIASVVSSLAPRNELLKRDFWQISHKKTVSLALTIVAIIYVLVVFRNGAVI